VKRIALLSLLLVPSVAGAQQADPVHSTPYPGQSVAVGTAVDQGLAQYNQPAAIAQHGDIGCPTNCRPLCPDTSGWFGDIGFYVLRPQWGGGNPAFATEAYANPAAGATFSQAEFEHDYTFTPLISIGYAGRNGLGVRGRWWSLRSEEQLGVGLVGDGLNDVYLSTPSLLGVGGVETQAGTVGGNLTDVDGSFRNRLSLDVIDLESIWDTSIGRSSLLMSAGVRYAHIGNTYDAEINQYDTVALTTESASLRSNNTFNGAGPTASLQAYRMIGQTNLSVYGLSRGSLLFGESRQRAFSHRDGNDFSASATSNAVRPVMELEVGTNWSRNMGAYDLFMENGLVGMVWFDAGNAANSDTLLGFNERSIGTGNANQDMGLLGLRFSTGVRF
jgi:hypothetical protein